MSMLFSDDEDDDSKEEIDLTCNIPIPNSSELAVLETNFGHSQFRPLQWKIINTLIHENRDVCAIIATGYGKSLCYQYPPVLKNGISIVISPLISLMEDQVLSLKMSNIEACFLGSAQTKRTIIKEIIAGKYRIVYATPEYLTGEKGMLDLHDISETNNITLLAIDEAHCVSQWGHDFRPQYRNLAKLRNVLLNVPVLAVTATATPHVQNDIIKILKLRNPVSVSSSFDRPNLYFEVKLKSSDSYADIKSSLGNLKHNGSTIIYCLTQKATETLYRNLSYNNIKCVMYHGGLTIKDRREAHEEFVTDKVKCIVATIAFGMGIDKPDVRNVIHYGASKDLEGYYQEVGRAGRDGLPAKCTLFFSRADFTIHDNLREKNSSNLYKKHMEQNTVMMEKYVNTAECRRKFILEHFNDQICDWRNLKPKKNCCDNCQKQLQASSNSVQYNNVDEDGKYDLTKDAKLLLEAVYSSRGKFGLGKYCLLLKGSKSSDLPKKLQNLPIFGKGSYQSVEWWKIVGRVLTTEGYLNKEHVKNSLFSYFTISLTSKGSSFLSDTNPNTKLKITPPLDMKKYMKVKVSTTQTTQQNNIKPVWRENSTKSLSGSYTISLDSENSEDLEEKSYRMELYKILLNVRNDLAYAEECSPYMIASNVALMNMSKSRPKSLEEFKTCKFDGMTEGKINKFGKKFVEVINNFCETTPSNTTECFKTDNIAESQSTVGISKLKQFAFVENTTKTTLDIHSNNDEEIDEISDSALNNVYDHLDGTQELVEEKNNITTEHTSVDDTKLSRSKLECTTKKLNELLDDNNVFSDWMDDDFDREENNDGNNPFSEVDNYEKKLVDLPCKNETDILKGKDKKRTETETMNDIWYKAKRKKPFYAKYLDN